MRRQQQSCYSCYSFAFARPQALRHAPFVRGQGGGAGGAQMRNNQIYNRRSPLK